MSKSAQKIAKVHSPGVVCCVVVILGISKGEQSTACEVFRSCGVTCCNNKLLLFYT